jgi:hypothetical protein
MCFAVRLTENVNCYRELVWEKVDMIYPEILTVLEVLRKNHNIPKYLLNYILQKQEMEKYKNFLKQDNTDTLTLSEEKDFLVLFPLFSL